MKVLFLTGQLVYNAHILEEYCRARPQDRISVVASNYLIKGKSTLESLAWISRQTGLRYVGYKIYETMATHFVWPSLKDVCARQGLPLRFSADVNDEQTLEYIRSFEPDLTVSMITQKIKSELISIAKQGTINVHPGDLPDYRGLGPYLWPLIQGARECGCSLHWIQDENLDTGNIIVKGTYPIESHDTAQSLYLKNSIIAARLLPEVAGKLQQGKLAASVQGDGKYYSWPSQEDMRRYRLNGRKLIRTNDLITMWRSKKSIEKLSYQTLWS